MDWVALQTIEEQTTRRKNKRRQDNHKTRQSQDNHKTRQDKTTTRQNKRTANKTRHNWITTRQDRTGQDWAGQDNKDNSTHEMQRQKKLNMR